MKGNFVYFFYDSNNTLLYVGKTTNLKGRMLQHFSLELLKLEPWRGTIDRSNIITLQCNNVCDLDLYETYLINKYNPLYNKDKVFNITPSFDLPYLEPMIYKFKLEKTKGVSFTNLSKEYLKLLATQSDPVRLLEIESTYPHLKEMVDTIGTKRVKSLSYNQQKIKHEMYCKSEDMLKVVETELKDKYLPGSFYLANKAKEELQEIYTKLNIKRKAKSTDIKDFLNANFLIKSIDNKKCFGFYVN